MARARWYFTDWELSQNSRLGDQLLPALAHCGVGVVVWLVCTCENPDVDDI
jgi:hypothetical protein